MLDEQQLGALIADDFRAPGDTLFRMESLPHYAVDSDGDDYHRWREGAPEPTWSRKQPWLDVLRRERDNGQVSQRVRVLSDPITDYERYSCEFGYAFNAAAGEDIRVLRPGEHPVPEGLVRRDFWIVNDAVGVTMHYDPAGRFLGAEVATPELTEEFREVRDELWPVAEPFARWWRRHPELHRRVMS